MSSVAQAELRQSLREAFGPRLREGVPLAPYTSARIGGPADFLLSVRSGSELETVCRTLWGLGVEFRMLGGGSNVLVSDAGVRGVIVLNQAKDADFAITDQQASVTAEAGASFGSIARRAVDQGLSGLEWAATIPGTVGGAIVGNAGAFGGDVSQVLKVADILQRPDRREQWPVERLEYSYRTSWLKRHPGEAVVLSGTFGLQKATQDATRARVAEFGAKRQQTQPPGASWGSMFMNPPGDHAGRLIEAAGLKGTRQGAAEISTRHANFFINRGGATAADVWALIEKARQEVRRQTGIELELEIERLGEWNVSRIA
ncbi:MAG: UDP-N-acetylmuramate dehydrogenase [Chloroflexi bacterium]|nr:UDP-N-acetylmuramate dehydrogenase [Chloroflexota bacterium]